MTITNSTSVTINGVSLEKHEGKHAFVGGELWLEPEQTPEPDVDPQPVPIPLPVPEVGTPVPTFAEDGIKQPKFAGKGIASFRPYVYALDNPKLLEHCDTLIWSPRPESPAGQQIAQYPWVMTPGYILTTVFDRDLLKAWRELGHEGDDGILAWFHENDKDGSEQAWADIFREDVREFLFTEAMKVVAQYGSALSDIYFNPDVNKNREGGNAAWQHAAGSLNREIARHIGEDGVIFGNVSNWDPDHYLIAAKYIGGLYLDRSFVKPVLDTTQLVRQSKDYEILRSINLPDYWSIQDSKGPADSPGWKLGDLCSFWTRMAVHGGWNGQHFFATSNNDAGAESHSMIERDHWVGACLFNPGKPVPNKDGKVTHWTDNKKDTDTKVFACHYEKATFYRHAAVPSGQPYKYLAPVKLPAGSYMDHTGEVREYADGYDLGPGEGVIQPR